MRQDPERPNPAQWAYTQKHPDGIAPACFNMITVASGNLSVPVAQQPQRITKT